MSTGRRALAIVALVALGILIGSPSAQAHALLGSADPEPGAQIDRAPAAISIKFTEEPEPTLSSIEVFDLDGGAHHTGALEQDPSDRLILRRPVGELAEGVYTVSWRVFSVVDGHVTGGAFAFGVGVDPSDVDLGELAAGDEAPPPEPLEVIARWIFFAGIGVLLGGVWVAAFALDEPAVLRRLIGTSWVVSAIGLIVLAEAQRRAAGAGIGALLGTPIGTALVTRAAAIGAAGLFVVSARGRRARRMLALAGLAAAAALFAHVAAGHAGTGERLWFKVVGQWVHVVAASVWLGGLAAVLAGIRGEPSATKARAVHRFSTVAGVALFVVLGTGIVRSLTELPTLGALTSSTYGVAIIIKAALLIGLGVLGAMNRYRQVPRAPTDLAGLRRISRAELGVAGVALLAASVLASTTPPRPVSATEAIAASPIEVAGTDPGGTTRVELTISPGFAGPNNFTARATDARSGAPIEAERATLLVGFLDDPSLGQSQVALARGEDGLYRASSGAMGIPGRWRLTVLLQTASDAVEVALEVATKCRTTATPVDGGPTLYDIRLGDGTAQGYTDPGRTGFNEVHITFFDPDGGERDIPAEPAMFATPEDGDRVTMVVRRFSKGHFLGDAQLTPGIWRFDVVGTGSGGEPVRICFNDEIRR